MNGKLFRALRDGGIDEKAATRAAEAVPTVESVPNKTEVETLKTDRDSTQSSLVRIEERMDRMETRQVRTEEKIDSLRTVVFVIIVPSQLMLVGVALSMFVKFVVFG